MPTRRVILGIAAATMLVAAAPAQVDLNARLSAAGHVGDVPTGAFSAGDSVKFSLIHLGDKYLLRFDNDPETYVLSADHASLGGRVLRYDTGATALQVAGWSAMTIYPDSEPSGLPAERTGEPQPLPAKPVTTGDLRRAAQDESAHLAYLRGLRIAFDADWPMLDGDAALRAVAFDALQNAARGIARFSASARGRIAVLAKLATVKIDSGRRPAVALHGKTLDVTVDALAGYGGRPSSRAVAKALGDLMAVPTAG